MVRLFGRISVSSDVLTATALGLAAQGAIAAGRPFALLALPSVATAVVVAARSRAGGLARAGIATTIGLAPGLVLLGVLNDRAGLEIPTWLNALLLQPAWTAASLSLGVAVSERVEGRHGLLDAWGRIIAIGFTTATVAGALLRLLLPSADTAARLAWILGEEDNAQIVGVAREVLVHGPRGAELASDYGTAFITLPMALLNLTGGPLSSEADVRLQAITLFTVSTVAAIIVAGLAMTIIASFPRSALLRGRVRSDRPNVGAVLLGAGGAALASLLVFSLLVVLPMRTGFLTFVWGLSLVLLAAGIVAATPPQAGAFARSVLLAHLIGTGVLLLSSWPFIGPALVPLGLVPLTWIRWGALAKSIRAQPVAASSLAVAVILAGMVTVSGVLRWGPTANILSFGTDLLTVSGSGIYADERIRSFAFIAIAALAALIALLARSTEGAVQFIALIGPVIGAGILYVGLRTAAALLTDGSLGYSGVKLFYGLIVLSAALGLLGLSAQAARLGTPALALVFVLLVSVHQASPTATLYQEWWEQTDLRDQANAGATVSSIRSTSVGLPIRCLPSPGTIVTDQTRWAAYFCARWMEDAFNEGRFHGNRFKLLAAEGENFGPTVAEIEASGSAEYLFAYRMTMGPGWFGWAGGAG